MNITKKQKQALWLIALVLAVLYYAPSVIMSVRQMAYVSQQAALRQAAPQQAAQHPPLPKAKGDEANGTAAVPESPVSPGTLSGFWQGSGTVPDKGRICSLHLELREDGQPQGPITGYPSLSCVTFGGRPNVNPLAPMMSKLDPVTAVMTGMWDKSGSLHFSIVKSLAASDSCPITGFTLTPFGTNAVTVEYQEGTCQSGNMVLYRTRT